MITEMQLKAKACAMEELAKNRKIYSDGYVYVIDYFGILGKEGDRVPEHRLIAAVIAGRALEDGEVVHHLDLDRSNNCPSNLVIVNNSEHGEFHRGENRVRRQKAKRQVEFSGRTPYLKMKCPWCGRIFYKRRSESVLVHDNKMHVNCCSRTCSNRLVEAADNGTCDDLARRVRENIVCEFKSNAPFMDRFVRGIYPSSWTIDDDGVFHGA